MLGGCAHVAPRPEEDRVVLLSLGVVQGVLRGGYAVSGLCVLVTRLESRGLVVGVTLP